MVHKSLSVRRLATVRTFARLIWVETGKPLVGDFPIDPLHSIYSLALHSDGNDSGRLPVQFWLTQAGDIVGRAPLKAGNLGSNPTLRVRSESGLSWRKTPASIHSPEQAQKINVAPL